MTKRARTIWIDDAEWEEAKEKAAQDDRSVSYLVCKLLENYVPASK
jgi:hypothetical protein